MTPLPKAIVFDFDLTLADSIEGFVDAYGHAARELGLPEPTRENLSRMIGTPLPLAIAQLFVDHDFDAEEYIRLYQARSDETMIGKTVMLEGAVDALHKLGEAGIKLGIVSQKMRHRVARVLQREGLLPIFNVVLGGDDVPDFKPDPRGLLTAIERLEATPDTSLYCGDTVIDAQAANNAGARFVAVLTGPTTADDFAPYEPLAILSSAGELPSFLGLT